MDRMDPFKMSVKGASFLAMRNEVVLYQIAKHLPAGDILTLRLTCSLWNGALIFGTRIHSPFTVKWLKVGLTKPDAKYCKWEDYASCIRASCLVPYSKCCIFDPCVATRENLKDFFESCGNSVRQLVLSYHGLPAGDDFGRSSIEKVREIVFRWTPELTDLTLDAHYDFFGPITTEAAGNSPRLAINLPSLRRLELKYYSNGPMSTLYAQLIRDLLANSINLKSLSLDMRTGPENRLLGISFVRDFLPDLSKLKSLTVTNLDPTSIWALIDLENRLPRLHLEKLSLVIWGQGELDAAANRLLSLLLESQALTLQKLDIKIEDPPVGHRPEEGTTAIRVPRAEHVREFHLKNWRGGEERLIEYVGERLAFALPSLRRITCDFEYIQLLTGQEPENNGGGTELVHAGVTEVKLHIRTYAQTLALECLPLMWSAVTRLELELEQLDPITFPVAVWTLWPGLVSIRLRYPFHNKQQLDLDEALTGIPKSSFEDLKLELSSFSEMSLEKVRSLASKYKTQPGISDLRELCEFVLIFDRRILAAPYVVTDIGGYFGFAMASPGMQRMVIENEIGGPSHANEGNQISDACRQFIRSAFDRYAVIRV